MSRPRTTKSVLLALLFFLIFSQPFQLVAQIIPAEEEELEEDAYTVETRSTRNLTAGDVSTSSESLSAEDLEHQGAPSLFDAIAQMVPWLYAPTDGTGIDGIGRNSAGGVGSRGLGPGGGSRILTVWDGMPDLNRTVGQLNSDFYVDALLSEVEVASGGDSVRWGSNAMLGVISLKSRWRHEPGWESHLDVGAGQGNQYNLQAAALGHTGKWSLVGAATSRHAEGALRYTEASVHTLQLGARRRLITGGHITLRARYGLLDGERGGTINDLQPGQFYHSERGVLQMSYTQRISPIMSMRLLALGSITRDRIYDGFHLRDNTLNSMAEFVLSPFDALNIRAGLALDSVDAHAGQDFLDIEFDIEPVVTTSLYLESMYQPWSDLSFVGGVRQVYGLHDEPGQAGELLYKAGVSYWAWSGGELRARISKNYRQPTPAELYVMRESSPDLDPEFARVLELGASQFYKHLMELRLTAYQLDSDDLIVGDGTPPDITLINAGEARSRGIETSARTKLWRERIEIGGAVTWTQQRLSEVQNNAPPVRASGWLGLVPSPSTRLQLNGSYTAPREVLGRDAGSIAARHNINVYAHYRPQRAFEIYTRVNNLLNLSNEFLPGNPSTPRRVFLGCRVHFDALR